MDEIVVCVSTRISRLADEILFKNKTRPGYQGDRGRILELGFLERKGKIMEKDDS